jgi:hypothetical protein
MLQTILAILAFATPDTMVRIYAHIIQPQITKVKFQEPSLNLIATSLSVMWKFTTAVT